MDAQVLSTGGKGWVDHGFRSDRVFFFCCIFLYAEQIMYLVVLLSSERARWEGPSSDSGRDGMETNSAFSLSCTTSRT